MKSKITLIVVVTIMIFLLSCIFFLGYNCLKSENNIQALNKKIDSLTQLQEIESQKTEGRTTAEPSQVVETEKLAIAKLESDKIEGDVTKVEEMFNTIKIGNATVRRQSTGNEMIGNYQGQILEYNDKNYTFNGVKIIDAIYSIYGDGSSSYYAVLLEDGTVQYSIEMNELQFKKVELDNIVRIISLKTTNSDSRIISTLGVITSDGITHVIDVNK